MIVELPNLDLNVCALDCWLGSSSRNKAKLKLLSNFQLQCFGFAPNVDRIGAYNIPDMCIGTDAIFLPLVDGDCEEHILETRVLNFVLCLTKCP